MVDLIVVSGLDLQLLKLKLLFTCVTKQAILMRRLTVLNLPLQLGFLGWTLYQACEAIS
jgi:hypothetical protein